MAQRTDQFAKQRLQMPLGSQQERFFKSLYILSSHAKFRELESKQLQVVSNPREHRHRQNLYRCAEDHRGNDAVARRKIFNDVGVLRKSSLKSFKGKIVMG